MQLHVGNKHAAWAATRMVAQPGKNITRNQIMRFACTCPVKDFAINIFVANLAGQFSMQIFLLA